jgi:two-component system response regulator EvgA
MLALGALARIRGVTPFASVVARMRETAPEAMIVSMCLRVVIVDDHARFRAQAAELLKLERFAVVGDADTGESGVELSRRLAPDLVLLDVGLPDANGFDLVPAMHATGAAVVLTSSRASRDYGRRIEDSGAEGFISKSELSGDAIRSLLR